MQTVAPDPNPPLGQALRLIVEGTASARSGDDFFHALVRSLATALGFRFGMIGALPPGVTNRVQTLAVWDGNSFIPNFEYGLEGTPCANIVGRIFCYFPSGVKTQFPRDEMLQQMGLQSYAGAPLFAYDGTPLGLLSVMHDEPTQPTPECEAILRIFATRAAAELQRQRAQQKLSANEARLRLLIEQIPAGVWTTDTELRFTGGRSKLLNSSSQSDQGVVGMALSDYFGGAKETEVAIAAHRAALRGESRQYELAWQGCVFEAHVEPLRGPDGRIAGVIGVALDITRRKRAEDALREARDDLEQRVKERTAELAAANERLRASEEHFKALADSNRRLLMELDHRVRNNLTGLLSVLSLMRGKASDVPSFAEAIESRIMAMVQVHRLMSEAAWGPVEIRTLAQSLLAATKMMACHDIPVEMVGPDVRLPLERAQALAMIILEWFTNSCKHGAHTRPTGRLRIEWELDKPRQRVRLHWRETGGPPIPQPVTASLGTDLVRAFASRELGGAVELRFPETGVNHLLEFNAEGEG